LNKVEEAIEKHEELIANMEAELSSDAPPSDPEFFNNYTHVKEELAGLMTEWENLHFVLEAFE